MEDYKKKFFDNYINYAEIFASTIVDYILNSNLRDIEKEIIKLRYGFYGRILNKHRQLIYQLERNIIKKNLIIQLII